MCLGTNRKASELGTSAFLPVTEDDSVVLGKYSDGCFFEEDTAVVVTKFADAHQIVM